MKYCCHRGLLRPSWRVDGGDVLRCGVGAEDGDGRVAGKQVDEEERGDRDEEDDDDEQHQPLGYVTGHVASFPPSVSPIPFVPFAAPPAAHDPRPRAPCPTMRPMPEEVPALSGRLRLAAAVGVGRCVAAGIVLRFWTRSALWLDEALTVDIARLPLHEIPEALKHDGAPPLYYYLLHFWISLFGQSNVAVRSLSGDHRRAHPAGGLAVRPAFRGPGRGVDDAGAVGQRPLRRLLRHRVPHVRAGDPADRLRLPGPARALERPAPGQPGRRSPS